MRWKYAWLIAGVLAITGCDDADETGAPVDASVIRDGMGMGGDGGDEADMGQGGDGGDEADMGQGGDGGDGGAGGDVDMGMGGDGGGEVDMMPLPACADGADNDADGLVDDEDPGCDGPEDDDETDPPILCANGVDDDDDGLIDLEDPGCEDGADFFEDDPDERPACANDADDDGDGQTDFPADVGCQAAGDNDETDEPTPRACSNEADDDGDGLTDYPFDPGCAGPGDHDEADPEGLPACGNGADDDGDGLIDYPDDNGCDAAGDYDERLVCAGNGHQIADLNAAIAADGYADGTTEGAQATEGGSCGGMAGGEQIFLYQVGERLARVTFTTLFEETAVPTVIYVRRACAGAEDLVCNRGSSEVPGTTATVERPDAGLYYVIVDTSSRQIGEGAFRLSATEEPLPACDDTVDNDEDGIVDFPNDPGCESADDDDETSPDVLPACADGIDNDGDELIDFPEDEDCEAAFDDSENRVGCLEDPNLLIVENSARFELNTANNNAGYTASCGGNAEGPEQVFLVQIRQPSGLRVETLPDANGEQVDTVLHARANDCDMGPEIGCNDDNIGTLSLLQFDALEPGNYYIFADRFGDNAGGPFAVQIDIVPLGAACQDGQDNDADGLADGEDPGCESPDDDDEADPDPPVEAACSNGVDDDDDGLIDFLDPGCTGVADDDEADPDPPAECANGQDDDEDGLIDFPADPGCAQPGDTSETNNITRPACSNGDDDDDDGLIDFEDPGCAGPGDLNELDPLPAAECANGVDDDDDALIDFPFDPGCAGPGDLIEADPDAPAQCSDEIDNDEDGIVDFPAEPGCAFAGDDDETDPDPAPACGNGEDDDGDGAIDLDDPGCDFAGDRSEINPAACADGADNDEDGQIDRDDPGCFGPLDDDETDPDVDPACSDGEDNDEDGEIDFPNDPECAAAGEPNEGPVCGALDLPTIYVGQAGGQVNFVPLRGPDRVTGSCIFGAEGHETLIVLTLDQPSTVIATFEGDVSRWVRRACDDAVAEIACESEFSDDALTLFRAEPGDYYFFVEPGFGDPAPTVANFDVRPVIRICADGEDNDEDGLVDFNDPGCRDVEDNDETDPPFAPVCNDGLDNDEDGQIDLDDADCTFAGGTSEAALCDDLDVTPVEVDQQGGVFDFQLEDGPGSTEGTCDTGGAEEQVFAVTIPERSHINVQVTDANGPAEVVVYARRACGVPGSEIGCTPDIPRSGRLNLRELEAGTYYIFVERAAFVSPTLLTAEITVQSAITECNDEVDNDDDDLIDLFDPGCASGNDDSEADPDEAPACFDDVDNDDDGLIDFPEDFGCQAAGDDGENLACQATEDVTEVLIDFDVAEPLVFEFNTAGREGLFDASCGLSSRSPEAVYAVVVPAPAAGSIEITDGGGRDTTLHMRAACDDQGSEIVCNDDGGAGLLSRLDFVRLEPGIYYVFADGYGDREGGPGELTIALEPAAAACGNGIDDDGDTLIDEEDPGCESAEDDDEFNEPLPQCSNRIDDDGDGLIDAEDDGCDGPDDDDEYVPPECGDGNIEERENCDDGNAEPGDGCDAQCQLEEVPDDGTIRLKDGPAGNFGRLEMFFDGEWGTVCDDGWIGEPGLVNADVACRELGYLGAAEVVLAGYDGADPTPIVFDDAACEGDEESLVDCPASPLGVENCGHVEDVALRCLLPGECRIDAQCEDGLDCVNGECGVAPPDCSNGVDDDGDGLIDGEDNGCDSPDDDDEATVPACGDGAVQGMENCDDGNLEAGDGCDENCQPEAPFEEGALRLKDGPVPFLGRLEVYANDTWGTVCDDFWNGDQAFINADVACMQLGYTGAYAIIDGLDGADPTPILLDNVECVGDEETLLACPSAGIGIENCGHGEDIGLRCLVDGQCRVDAQCADGLSCVENACVEPPPPPEPEMPPPE